MSMSLITTELLHRLFSISITNLVLWWGVFRFVPTTLNNYGFDYFEWKRFKRQGLIGGAIIVCTANAIIAGILKLNSAALPFWTSCFLALILVSCWGVWKLDRAFQIIPDRFHLTGFIGASGYLAAGITAAPELLSLKILGVTTGLLLPASLLGLNYLYTKFRNADGLGLGDVKALLWLPLAIGDQIWIAFASACIIAGIAQALKMLLRRNLDLQSPFAFGPYIIFCAIAALLTRFPFA